MDSTQTRVYEDFVPKSELVHAENSDTLQLFLPGFNKEQLKVQLTREGMLRISGERPMGENKWQRFQKEFAASASKKDKESAAKEAENTPAAADESSSYSKPTDDATPTQVYEDFLPSSKVVLEQHCNTLHLDLPGFKKEQVTVQLTKTGIMKISGQRPIGQNKWQRFQMEFPAAENCDKSKISSKFENGILHVIQPKLIPSASKKDKESAAKEAENTPPAKTQTTTSQKDNADTNTPAREEPKNDSPKTSEQKEAKSLAEKNLPADESSSYSKPTDDAKPTQVYEDFVPSSKLVQEQHSDILHLDLPGFKKEQVTVQLTKTGMLKISGQRPIGQNKWQRFQMEFAA